ncbi:MAG: SPOR domain-containing protein [Methylobacter sp.]
MDHELKQRLIGAVVVTALCAIFIPMLFDDPVDNSGQLVSELNIPTPAESGASTADKLPTSAEQVSKLPDLEPLSTEAAGDTLESTGAAEEIVEETASSDQPKQGNSEETLYAESDGYTRENAGAEESVESEDNQSKSRIKQLPAEQPLSADAADGIRKSVTPKAQVKEPRMEAMVKEPAKVKKVAEPARPMVKKPEIEPLIASKENATKAAALQPALKQPNNAKSLAAAVAEAKKPVVAPKPAEKLVRWYIQLGSFSKKENAMSLWDSLHEQGLPASLDTVQTDKGTSYRLRVGPELDGKKAAAMKARLDKLNIKAILISE